MDGRVKKRLLYIYWDEEINANESFMPNLLSTTQTMNLNWSSSAARHMLTVAHVASLTPKCNARRLRVCATVNSGRISGGLCPTIKARPVGGFLADGCNASWSVTHWTNPARLLIGPAVMSAHWRPRRGDEIRLRIPTRFPG